MKRWVNRQLTEGIVETSAMEAEAKQLRAALNKLQNDIDMLANTMQTKEDKMKCFGTNGGKISSDLNMQNFRICIPPEAKAADEFINNGTSSTTLIP